MRGSRSGASGAGATCPRWGARGPSEAVLGVIPMGTFNHFARDVGVPMAWREALDVALTGTTRQVDAARANDRFFVNNIAMGLYPELVARREERGREYPRWKARLYAAYATLQ